jgi:hypothetical protein
MLRTLHGHPLDKLLRFEPVSHVYTVIGDTRPYTSVTKWNHSHFAAFDAPEVIRGMMCSPNWPKSPYYGQSAEDIQAGWSQKGQEAARKGTALHARIENYYNQVSEYTQASESETEDTNCKAWDYFQNFLSTVQHLKPYRTEWMIFHEPTQLAGSVDMVYEQSDGTLLIYDWKRIKDLKKAAPFGKCARTPCIEHLPDSNYWHYALQLNTYKMILEASYQKKVMGLFLVLLHPDLPNFQVVKLPFLAKELLDLVALRSCSLKAE